MIPDDLIGAWGIWLRDGTPRTMSPTTIIDYQRVMRQFAAWMDTVLDHPLTPDHITPYRVEQYFASLEQQIYHHQRRHATYNKHVTIHRTFGAWLVAQGYVGINPAARLRVLSQQPSPVRTLTAQIMRRVRDAAHHTGDLRDAVVVELLATTGMRASEVAHLGVEDFAYQSRRMWVHIVGKGRKYRRVPVTRSVENLIHAYLEQRAQREGALPTYGPLLIGERGRITRTTINRIVTHVVQMTRLSDHERQQVTPHAFRHTVATQLARTQNLVVAADVLGHQSLTTTRRYVQATAEELERAIATLEQNDGLGVMSSLQ